MMEHKVKVEVEEKAKGRGKGFYLKKYHNLAIRPKEFE